MYIYILYVYIYIYLIHERENHNLYHHLTNLQLAYHKQNFRLFDGHKSFQQNTLAIRAPIPQEDRADRSSWRACKKINLPCQEVCVAGTNRLDNVYRQRTAGDTFPLLKWLGASHCRVLLRCLLPQLSSGCLQGD